MIFRLLMIALLVCPLSSFAQEDCADHATKNTADHLMMHARGCPNDAEISTLCGMVDLHLKETESSPNKYMYQTIIQNASCVLPTDSAEVKRIKINSFWDKYGSELTCKNINFSVNNGLLTKFAVSKHLDSFIVDITRNWKVNLNNVDPADQRTVLDYVHDELAKAEAENSPLRTRLKTYLTLLKAAGAKRKSEL